MHLLRTALTFAPFLLSRAFESNPPGDPPADPPEPPEPIVPDPKTGQFSQEQLDQIVKREKAAAARQAVKDLEAKQAKDKQAEDERLERERLEKAGEFDTVKAALEKRATDAEQSAKDAAAERDILVPWFTREYDQALESLPPLALALKPADDATLAEKVAWLTTVQEAVEKTNGVEKPRKPGSPPNPKPNGTPTADDEAALARARRRVAI